jgi:hypothetical protein
MFKKFLFLTIIFAMLLPISAFASVYGRLTGKVIDEEGKGVLGATVRVQGTTLGAPVRNKDGSYTIVNIPAGSYEVLVRAVGKTEVTKKVRVSADETAELNFTMGVESIKMGVVEVYGNKMVSKDAEGKKQTYSSEEIKGTTARGVTGIVGLSAGVRDAGAGFSIRGARSSETQVKVDGLDVGNAFTGGMGFGGTGYYPMVSQYGTEEVQVLTGGFSAEYGNSQGGVVNTSVKTGRTDKYEALMSYYTGIPSLWGRQAYDLDLQKVDSKWVPVEGGEGAQLQGGGEQSIDFGIGGPLPLPFFKHSTFFISTSYFYEKYRSNSYEIYDPAGNNLGQYENNQTWRKNITGRIRFAINEDIGLILGSNYGVTSAEFGGWYWLYANGTGLINGADNGVSEKIAKVAVGNQIVYNFMARINHNLTPTSFYEFTISRNTNNDVTGRRDINPETGEIATGDPDFFTGFKILEPRDEYVIDGSTLSKGQVVDGRVQGDKILDEYTGLTTMGITKDGYLKGDQPVRNPLTGYFEGPGYDGGTNNAYGMQNLFATTGTGTGVDYRLGTYWQFDGSYTNSFKTGEFGHFFKTGFQLRFYEFHRHNNGSPYDGNPFFDIYTDLYGGNLYADTKKVWDLTSKPYQPMEFGMYIQDQIKYKGIVINPGVRLDMIDPSSNYRLASANFIPISSDTGFVVTKMKYQISPRLNVAYPITDNSVISIAYGLYFKTPQFQYMYDNFAIDILRASSLIGNPNMEAQQTSAYQVAYNQQFNDYLALGVTAYYNDRYNQLGTMFIPAVPTPYFQYTITEYSTSKGLEFELRKRPAGDHLLVSLSYTLSNSVGTAPSATSNFNVSKDPYTGELTYPLAVYTAPDNLTHWFKGYINFIWGNDEGPSIFGLNLLENTNLNFTGSWRSGYPYTKTDKDGKAIGEYNAETQPSFYTISTKLMRSFQLSDIFGSSVGNTWVDLYVDVFNLFNFTRPVAVSTTTGDPVDNGRTLEVRIGDFNSTTWYKDATYENTASFAADQYDRYGNRLYNVNSDFDKNGIVTQSEKYQTYINYVETAWSFLGNYQAPRTVYFGVMIRFN